MRKRNRERLNSQTVDVRSIDVLLACREERVPYFMSAQTAAVPLKDSNAAAGVNAATRGPRLNLSIIRTVLGIFRLSNFHQLTVRI